MAEVVRSVALRLAVCGRSKMPFRWKPANALPYFPRDIVDRFKKFGENEDSQFHPREFRTARRSQRQFSPVSYFVAMRCEGYRPYGARRRSRAFTPCR